MSDIFVSYKREDFGRVEQLVGALRAEGFDVWWDQDIPPGAPWEAAITAALDDARCVLVCWSKASTDPQGGAKVQVEARVANDAGKLIQVKLEPISQPLFFRQWQAADLSAWSGERSDAMFLRLAAAARDVVSGARLPHGHFHEPAKPARAKTSRVKIGLASLAAAVLGVVAFGAASADGRLFICNLTNATKLCTTDKDIARYEAALADAKARLAQSAIFYISDRRQNFPSIGWTIAQLAAPNADSLESHWPAFDSRLQALIDKECGCLTYGPAPHTISNVWYLIALSEFEKPAPASVIDAVLAGQSTQGWWSSTLDAVDELSNGATYATAFVVYSLTRQLPLTQDEARAAAMRRAIDAGSGWLVNQTSKPEGFLADYPQSVRNLSIPGIDGQALAALAVARPEVNLKARTRGLAKVLDRLPPLWETQSSDVLVMRRNDAQYYDDFRHISAAWTVLGAVSGLPDLDPMERARVESAVRRVFERDLASPELFEREWVAAEAIFALGEAVERLKLMSENGMDGAPAAVRTAE